MEKIRSKMFDIADQHAAEIKQELYNPKVLTQIVEFEVNSGVWFGSIYAIVKVEPFNDFDNSRLDYYDLEDIYPFLKEEKDVRDGFDDWFNDFSPSKVGGNEVEFLDLTVEVKGGLNKHIGRVYRNNGSLGVISVDYDYLGYDLNLKFISKNPREPIIGLKSGEGNIKDRAIIIIMPLSIEEENIRKAIDRTKNNIESLKTKL